MNISKLTIATPEVISQCCLPKSHNACTTVIVLLIVIPVSTRHPMQLNDFTHIFDKGDLAYVKP